MFLWSSYRSFECQKLWCEFHEALRLQTVHFSSPYKLHQKAENWMNVKFSLLSAHLGRTWKKIYNTQFHMKTFREFLCLNSHVNMHEVELNAYCKFTFSKTDFFLWCCWLFLINIYTFSVDVHVKFIKYIFISCKSDSEINVWQICYLKNILISDDDEYKLIWCFAGLIYTEIFEIKQKLLIIQYFSLIFNVKHFS